MGFYCRILTKMVREGLKEGGKFIFWHHSGNVTVSQFITYMHLNMAGKTRKFYCLSYLCCMPVELVLIYWGPCGGKLLSGRGCLLLYNLTAWYFVEWRMFAWLIVSRLIIAAIITLCEVL